MTTTTFVQDSLTPTPNPTTLRKKTKLLVLAQVGFAAMTAMGSSMELAAQLNIIQLPEAVEATLGRWHEPALVRYWVLLSNTLSLLISVGLVAAALSFLTARKGSAKAAKLSGAMVVLFAIGQVVMVLFVYPQMPSIALIPAIMGTVGSLAFATFLCWFWKKQAATSTYA